MTPEWFVYVLRCGDGSLYAGIAKDVDARFALHVAGKGARYTRGRGPLAIAARAGSTSKSHALRAEIAWKKLPRARKDALLVAGFAAFVSRSAPRSG